SPRWSFTIPTARICADCAKHGDAISNKTASEACANWRPAFAGNHTTRRGTSGLTLWFWFRIRAARAFRRHRRNQPDGMPSRIFTIFSNPGEAIIGQDYNPHMTSRDGDAPL